MSFSIQTDTSANLPTDLLRREEITATPFPYAVNGRQYACTDTEEFDGARFYDAMRRGAQVTTSLVAPQQYRDSFRRALEAGLDVLFVGMSSGISGSFASAELAAQELREEYPGRSICTVDSLGASLGTGLLVLRAVECRRSGVGVEETARLLLGLRRRVCQVFTVDDLRYLRRGGRISNAAAIAGTVLHIKPLLKGDPEGHIVLFAKVRGRKRSIAALAERYEALVEHAGTQTVGIAHADCPEDAAELSRMLMRSKPPAHILEVCYEPVTGSHVGPGALALFFIGGVNVREK